MIRHHYKFTDYRTYKDYDIKIKNNRGDVILIPKDKEEPQVTQAPFT